jgi:hypothetical protein
VVREDVDDDGDNEDNGDDPVQPASARLVANATPTQYRVIGIILSTPAQFAPISPSPSSYSRRRRQNNRGYHSGDSQPEPPFAALLGRAAAVAALSTAIS